MHDGPGTYVVDVPLMPLRGVDGRFVFEVWCRHSVLVMTRVASFGRPPDAGIRAIRWSLATQAGDFAQLAGS